ncbi:gamma-glutamyl cyclotransferase [Bacillus phage G]|uniref:Gp513 n=1 Tax=Bacillus phage G TaxID=2884420 RepID=G3MAQ4_9CAUD|nr:gamma-glutamyl cyclotransferase [Bacillus phage G]AEO93771.1 gp513 [Bacillus phage G]
MIPIFVYGGLRKDLYNYERVLKGKTTSILNATIDGYTMLNLGDTPGIIAGDNTIVGEVMNINPSLYLQTLQLLDRLEGYNPSQKGKSPYHREIKKVKLEDGKEIDAYVYVYNVKQGINFPVIASGDWTSSSEKKSNVK